MTTTTDQTPNPLRRGYGELWRAVPGSALYLILAFVIAMVSLSLLMTLFFAGVGMIPIVVGVFVLTAALLVARGFGVADRFLLRLTGLPRVAEPEWNRDRDRGGFWRTVTRPMRNPHYWTSLLHGAVISPIISIVTFAFTVAWLSISLGGLTFWFWGAFLPESGDGLWGDNVAEALPWLFGAWTPEAVEVTLQLVAGIVFAATLPWVLGAMSWLHHGAAQGLLGRWRSDDLAAEARAEAQARDAAVHAEDAGLRRLERDIHDGPQQRLVRLQLDLAALERRAAAGDADGIVELARESRGHAHVALDELRALSAGVAPPLLQDRGLSAALAALAAGSALPTRAELAGGLDDEVPPEVARGVYFVVAELLTNVTKHADATAATVRAALRPGPAGATLDVWVVDNGAGGARQVPGHGLAGLAERVQGLRGRFEVESPTGGPTTIGVHIPLSARSTLEA